MCQVKCHGFLHLCQHHNAILTLTTEPTNAANVGTSYAFLTLVIVLASLLVFASAGMGVVFYHVQNAPEGIQDGTGFHAVPKGSTVAGSGVRKRADRHTGGHSGLPHSAYAR